MTQATQVEVKERRPVLYRVWLWVVEWGVALRDALDEGAWVEYPLLELRDLAALHERTMADLAATRAANAELAKELTRVRLRQQAQGDELDAAWSTERRLLAELARVAAERDGLKNGETASGLSPAEVERLALLGMAAGKLAAEAAKVVLFGWASPAPATGRPAYADVEHGMGRLAAIVELMVEGGDVRGGDVRAHACRAKERMGEQVTRQGR
jgi:hypothetical protein